MTNLRTHERELSGDRIRYASVSQRNRQTDMLSFKAAFGNGFHLAAVTDLIQIPEAPPFSNKVPVTSTCVSMNGMSFTLGF